MESSRCAPATAALVQGVPQHAKEAPATSLQGAAWQRKGEGDISVQKYRKTKQAQNVNTICVRHTSLPLGYGCKKF